MIFLLASSTLCFTWESSNIIYFLDKKLHAIGSLIEGKTVVNIISNIEIFPAYECKSFDEQRICIQPVTREKDMRQKHVKVFIALASLINGNF